MTPRQWAVATIAITAAILGAVQYLWLLYALAPELFR